MRLTSLQLFEITGYERRKAQAKWFLQFLAVDIPSDRLGVILTDSAWQKLLDKRLGLGILESPNLEKPRPKIRPKDSKS